VVGVVRYGLYPVASMDEMVQDVGAAAAFVLEGGLARFGGDARRVSLMGHSAGAQLVAMAALRRAQLRAVAAEEGGGGGGGPDLERVLPPPLPPGTKWTRCVPHPVLIGHAASLSQVLLVSGPYDIPRHYEWERGRGVHLLSPMHVVAGSRCDSCVLAMTYVC
jgi:pimeloyl-ACP methyl ester carboxylesterase